MSARFSNPFPQFFNSIPQVLANYRLFFYAAGTSTKLDTFSDQALTVPNTNPVVLNSWGYPPTDVFLQDQAYKVVLAPPAAVGVDDPPSSPIWTADNYWGTDLQTVVQTLTGSGSPTGVVAGTAGSAGVLPTFYWDFVGKILYVATTTGNPATTVWTAINASAATPSVPAPQGYLTLSSGTPVITGDVVAATQVFYTPDKGNLIPIYNGATFSPTAFSELSLSLVASHAASTIYDLFVFSNSGVLTLVTGPAWTTSTAGAGARGSGASTTQLTRISGVLVNAVLMTGRNGSSTFSIGANLATYVGSIFMDAVAGQVTCHRAWGQSRKWGLWNAFNQRKIILQAGDATASWLYNSATVRASNAASANKATVFQGLQDGLTTITFDQNVQQSASRTSLIGIGINSTTAFTGFVGSNVTQSSNASQLTLHTYYEQMLSLGINDIQSLESGSVTFNGTQTSMQLTTEWMG